MGQERYKHHNSVQAPKAAAAVPSLLDLLHTSPPARGKQALKEVKVKRIQPSLPRVEGDPDPAYRIQVVRVSAAALNQLGGGGCQWLAGMESCGDTARPAAMSPGWQRWLCIGDLHQHTASETRTMVAASADLGACADGARCKGRGG